MPKKAKSRLDQLLVDRDLVDSRSKARALILAGQVLVNGARVDKAGQMIPHEALVELKEVNPYVSRGGLKIQGAWQNFQRLGLLETFPNIVLDVGASTGGFTDFFLQHGTQKVYAVDVGYGQLDWKLRNDPRVVVMEKQNIRELNASAISEKVDLICIDVSFISILKFFSLLKTFLVPNGKILSLIKPQFEALPEQVGKGGVIRDPDVIDSVVQGVLDQVEDLGFGVLGKTPSPITGAKGNQEYFGLFSITN